ncbi:unnamed protein product, partial [Ectocarpus sp. 6 AP-2014]
MKLARRYCFLLALCVFLADHLAFAQPTGGRVPSAPRYGLARFAEEDVKDTGVGHVHAIPEDEHQVEEELVEVLETDELTTVVGDIELGDLLCDSLEDASDSSLLRFAISSTETVVAERTSYSFIDGNVLPDGNTRKTWMGEVVDPEPSVNSIPRTVSMTWTDLCDIETFLLKLVSRNSDGSTSIVTSVPCSAGSSNEICMVELEKFFYDESDAVDTAQSSSSSSTSEYQGSRMLKERRVSTTHAKEGSRRSQDIPSDRSLQGTTVIDVLIFYSPEAASSEGISDAQLLTRIVEGMVTLNQAITNSAIADLEYRLVQVAELPYSQITYDPTDDIDLGPELDALAADSDVDDLRDQYQGDLVQLVGYFPGTCGLGYIFNGNAEFGFSLVGSNCFDNLSHTHEIAHNMGCYHDRLNSNTQDAYRHGYRYCTGTDPYRTIMSYYQNGCGGDPTPQADPIVPRVNYFSNPDVTYLNKATGTDDEDNARCIEE